MNEIKSVVQTAKAESTIVEYIPFGATDKIKLSLAIVQNLIAVKTKSGKTCSNNDAIKFMAMCQAKHLNPFEGDAFLIGYDGRDGATFSLITAHQTYLKRAELHPEYDGMESGVLVRDENHALQEVPGDFVDDGMELVGGWCRVHFKNRKHPMYKRVKLERFRKPFGVWQDDPAGMIVKCAEADALRSSFPTMLGGLYMREEVEVHAPELAKPDFSTPVATPMFTVPPAVENGNKAPEAPPGPMDVAPGDSPTQFNPLLALRNKAKQSNVSEAEILAFVESKGLTDGSDPSLDDVRTLVVKTVHDKWDEVLQEIKSARSGKDML